MHGNYAIKIQLANYKTFDRTGLRIGTQQFITLDVTLELGTLQETVTVVGASPVIDTSNASTGGALDSQQLEMLPAPGRNAFLIGVTVPTVNPVGDPQFNRQQDQTNASRVSLGGGGIRANNYLLDGVPITELRGRAIANPTIEAIEEIKVQIHTYDAGDGPHRGRGVQRHREIRHQRLPRPRLLPDSAGVGTNDQLLQREGGRHEETTGVSDSCYGLYGGGVGGPIFRNRTFFWGSTEGYRSSTTRGLQYLADSPAQRRLFADPRWWRCRCACSTLVSKWRRQRSARPPAPGRSRLAASSPAR